MRRAVVLLPLALLPSLLAVAACELGAADWSGDSSETAPCAITLCLAGAGGDLSVGNDLLGELCADLPGLVRRCDGPTCDPLWGTVDGAWGALVDVAGRADDACTVSLVGHSWGGVNLAELATRLRDRDDVREALRRVDRAVLIDAYAPSAGDHVDLPDLVRDAWSYRHSTPEPEDCSGGIPLGPYTGLPLRCGPTSACRDFDLSLQEQAGFVGHCEIIELVRDAVVENVVTGADASAGFPAVDVQVR